MNRRILLQVTAPAMVIGLLLLGACVGGAWSSTRLQRNLDRIRSESVVSVQAAQQLEIYVRQLRFHCFRYLIDPSVENHKTIVEDEEKFRFWLDEARRAARTREELNYVGQIETGFGQYQGELARLREEVARTRKPVDFQALDKGHPIRHVTDPCRELLRVSTERMAETFQESERVSRQALLGMILLGVGGPLGGVICGYGIARALSRSIYQLSVCVQDISQRLDRELAAVSVAADGDLAHLDQQLQEVVRRVEEVTQRAQQHQRERRAVGRRRPVGRQRGP
jgi:two-component system sensor histidine kinase HydH